MTSPVLLRERITTSAGLGESHFREFKSAQEGPPAEKVARSRKEIAKDICSTLVGFANADGGTLLVGVEDNGSISGLIDCADATVAYLLDCWKDGVHKDTPLRNVQRAAVTIDDQLVLYFSVLKSAEFIHQTSDGRCLQRKDLETAPISVEEIQYSRQEKTSQEYDRSYIDAARVNDLNLDAVRALANQVSLGMSVEKCLQYLDLADFVDGNLRLRRAALLLFAQDIVRWHPRIQIRIIRVEGTELIAGSGYNVISDAYVRGNILELIDSAWSELRPHLVQTRLSGAAKFETKVLYPELACREALINAIAHRDYSQEGRGVEIYVFQDRMEVKSPGGLLSTISIRDLRSLTGVHQSRNTFVARVLRELGAMREMGEGMKRIFELMQSNELAEPEINSEAASFTVTLSNKTLYAPEHSLWLENFTELDLSREEKAIVVLGYGGRKISPNDIWNTLGIVDTENYRQILYGLQKKGILSNDLTKAKAQRLAKLHKLNVRDVPRFVIALPGQRKPEFDHGKPKRTKRIIEEADNFDRQARLYVANVPFEISEEQFRESLRKRGYVVDVDWPTRSGRRKSFLFLQFDSREAALAAMVELDGLVLGDRTLVAKEAEYREPRSAEVIREGGVE